MQALLSRYSYDLFSPSPTGAIADRLNLLQYLSRSTFFQGIEISNKQAPEKLCSKKCFAWTELIMAGQI